MNYKTNLITIAWDCGLAILCVLMAVLLTM